MSKGRLEAFSDGVIAIIITIMVLELRPPEGSSFEDLTTLVPTFVAYVLSFGLLGTYWANHHHLLQTAKTVDGRVLWTNLHLLFWLSLFPFGTAWVGDSDFACDARRRLWPSPDVRGRCLLRARPVAHRRSGPDTQSWPWRWDATSKASSRRSSC